MARTIRPWGGKRIAALVLVAVIFVLGVVAALNRMGDARFYSALVVGIVLGAWYVMRGDLPDRVYDASESRWNLGPHLTREDDPRNISPKVYLPLILLAILGGIIAFLVVMR
jgi:hypothetical protein